MHQKIGLYIHIPFCVKKCDYCDFLSFGGTSQATKDLYIEALCREIDLVMSEQQINTVDTIYIGGGTPSILSVENFNRLMTTVFNQVILIDGGEFTVEVNPGSLTSSLLDVMVRSGVNRVSMGLQSSDDDMLQDLGRIHSYDEFLTTYRMLMSAGIDNISIDLMFGLSGQSMNDWVTTVEKVIDLKPSHISAYSLIIEEGTRFEERYDAGMLDLPNEEVEREMFWHVQEMLEDVGYHHYEISNYAMPGYEAKHNSSYWELTSYIGVGLGASSYYKDIRYKNISDMSKYIDAKGDLEVVRGVEQECTDVTDLEEAFFLGLRKLDGVDLSLLEDRFGKEALKKYEDIIVTLIEKELLTISVNNLRCIRLTKRGVDISNQVMSQFILL